MSVSIVLTTCGSRKEAGKISDALLKKKLAACVKMSETRSSYWWKGKIERSKEFVVSVVADRKKSAKIISAIKKLHSYDVPEIIEIPVSKADRKYARWVREVSR